MWPRTVGGIILLLMLILVLTHFLYEVIHYSTLYQEAEEQAYQRNLETARAVGDSFSAYVQGLLVDAQVIGKTLTAEPQLPAKVTSGLLSASKTNHETILDYDWLDVNGKVVASSDPMKEGENMADLAQFQEISAGQDWAMSDLFLDPTSNQPVFQIAKGFRDDNGKLAGVVLMTIDAQKLGPIVDIERVEQGTEVLIDRQGRLVHIHPEANLDWEQRDLKPSEPLLEQALQGKEAAGTIDSNVDGKNRTAGFAPIPLTGWVARASLPVDQVFAPVTDELIRETSSLVIFTAIAFAVGLVVSRAITVPIHRLGQRTRAFARGEVQHFPPMAGPTEIADLAAAFQNMVDELRARSIERERLLADVQRRAAELDATINAAADGILILNSTEEIIQINPAAERILGFTPQDYRLRIGDRMRKLDVRTVDGLPVSPADDPSYRALQGETIHNAIMVVHRSTEPPRWLSNSAAPIVLPTGEVAGAVSTYSDITQVQRLQEQQEQFVHTITHDLRAPLAVIIGQAQLLARALAKLEPGRPERRSVEAILTGAGRLNVMIQDLGDSAQLEAGQLKLAKKPVQMRQFVTEYLDRSRTTIEVSRLRVTISPDLPPVSADPDRLERILTNLISNALKYSTPGTPILIEANRSDGELVLAVADQGEGIAPEDLPHIFERGFRARNQKKVEGLGLGLYITKMLVEAHSGRAWVESKTGQGSTFYFTLPIVASSS